MFEKLIRELKKKGGLDRRPSMGRKGEVGGQESVGRA